MTSVRWSAAALFLLTTGCAAPGANGAADSDAGPAEPRPVIERVQPESGRAGEAYPIELTITGGPFDPEGNVVRFGPWTLGAFASTDGRTLVVILPKSIRASDEAPPMIVQAGSYPIVVETSRGVTEPFEFTLTPGERP